MLRQISHDEAQRIDAVLLSLDQAWDGKEYNPTEFVEEFAVAIRYCHLYFNLFVRLDLSPPGLAWFSPRLLNIQQSLATLDKAWVGDKYVGRYETAAMNDAIVRVLHEALAASKAETVKRGGWPGGRGERPRRI